MTEAHAHAIPSRRRWRLLRRGAWYALATIGDHLAAARAGLDPTLRARLDLVHCPVLLFRSEVDRVVPMASKDVVVRQVSSQEITEVVLIESDHVAPLDNDADLIVADTLDFLARHSR